MQQAPWAHCDQLMMSHRETKNTLHNLQHGFRSKSCCKTQIRGLTSWMSEYVDKVSHPKQEQKIHSIGVKTQITDWVNSSLSHTTEKVAVVGCRTNHCNVTTRVSRDPILGTTSYRRYCNIPLYQTSEQLQKEVITLWNWGPAGTWN